MRLQAVWAPAGATVLAFDLAAAAPGDSCPDHGITIVPAQVKPSGSQRCPRVAAGLGIPAIGQFQFFGFPGTCPVVETKIDAHAEVVPKEGFRAFSSGTYAIWQRDVECNTKANLVVVGLAHCEGGEWRLRTEKNDYDEDLCQPPPK